MNIYTNIQSNKNKTALLLGLFLVMIIGLGWLFSLLYDSYFILIVVTIVAVAQVLISYFSGDKIALTVSGAKQIQKPENPMLWNLVQNLSITSGLPMPKVYIINDSSPNAFATGRDPDHASLAVTSGLLETLDKSELEGVIAHELSHIGNFDIRLMMIVVVLVGVIALFSDIFIRLRFFGFGGRKNSSSGGGRLQLILLVLTIIAAVLAPIAAMLIQLAISRKREFLADSSGVMLTRYPEGLANALKKIASKGIPTRRVSTSTAHLYIANPYGKKNSSIMKLFSTHPPVEERISAILGK